jgi:hypothetical protein
MQELQMNKSEGQCNITDDGGAGLQASTFRLGPSTKPGVVFKW